MLGRPQSGKTSLLGALNIFYGQNPDTELLDLQPVYLKYDAAELTLREVSEGPEHWAEFYSSEWPLIIYCLDT